MALPWVRLDTTFPSNPKVLYLMADEKYRAGFVYLCSLSYSGAHGTDGFIPRMALAYVHGTEADAAALVDVGLWHQDRKGWLINDWGDYQPLSEATRDTLAAKRSGAKKGNCIRWHGKECGCWRGT